MRPDIVALLYGLAGLVFVAIGVPLALERVPPNHWYGFRTAKTFSNQTIWYAANRVAGIDLIIAGVVIALGMLAMFVPHAAVLPTLSIARWGFGLFLTATTVVVLLVLEPGLTAKMPRAASRGPAQFTPAVTEAKAENINPYWRNRGPSAAVCDLSRR